MTAANVGIDRCPKCGAKTYLDSDYHGFFTYCLQCGYTRDVRRAETNPKAITGAVNRVPGMAKP